MRSRSLFVILTAACLSILACHKSNNSSNGEAGGSQPPGGKDIKNGDFSDTLTPGARLWVDDATQGLFHNVYINIVTGKGVHGWNYGIVHSSESILACSVGDNASDNSDPQNMAQLVLNPSLLNSPQSCGTHTISGSFPQVNFSLYLTAPGDNVRRSYIFSDDPLTPGTVTLTRLGAVGDTITARFTGTLVEYFHAGHTIKATGFIKVVRNANQ